MGKVGQPNPYAKYTKKLKYSKTMPIYFEVIYRNKIHLHMQIKLVGLKGVWFISFFAYSEQLCNYCKACKLYPVVERKGCNFYCPVIIKYLTENWIYPVSTAAHLFTLLV